MISVELLGGASLQMGQVAITGPAVQRHRLALVAILAATYPKGVSRDKLTALIWPERNVSHGRNLLRQAVHAVRGALGDGAITTAGDTLRLDPARLRVDLLDFRAAIEVGDPSRAVRGYAGVFLDGFFLPDAQEFENWVEAERSRVRDAYLGALEQLAVQAESRGEFTIAVGWWRRLTEEDPYSSRITIRLMEALESVGDAAAAVRQAELHAQALRELLAAEPSPAVLTLAARMRRQPAPALSKNPPVVLAGEPGLEASEKVPVPGPATPTPAATMKRRPPAHVAWRLPSLLVLAFLAWFWRVSGPARAAGERVGLESYHLIAVLPFEDLTPNGDLGHLGRAVAEEIGSLLAGVEGLNVVSRSALSRLVDTQSENPSRQDVGTDLAVNAVLDGSVRREGDQVRVVAQLAEVGTNRVLWAESFGLGPNDRFLLRGDETLGPPGGANLAADAAARLTTAASPAQDAEAWRSFLLGRMLWSQRTATALQTSIEHFQRAIELDPAFAPAYAGLSFAYIHLHDIGREIAPPDAFERGRALAYRALELDPELAAAHAALGLVEFYEGRWRSSLSNLRNAVRLDPEDADVLSWLAYMLANSYGDLEAALPYAKRAHSLDPISAVPAGNYASILLWMGEVEEALHVAETSARFNPDVSGVQLQLAQLYADAGRFDAALPIAERVADQALLSPSRVAASGNVDRLRMASLLAHLGQEARAREILADAMAHEPTPFAVGLTYAHLGDLDAAFAWLNRGGWQHGDRAALEFSPSLESLRADNRFPALFDRVKREIDVH